MIAKTTLALHADNAHLHAENRRLSRLMSSYTLASYALALRWLMEQPAITLDPLAYHRLRREYEAAMADWLDAIGGRAGVERLLAEWETMMMGAVA